MIDPYTKVPQSRWNHTGDMQVLLYRYQSLNQRWYTSIKRLNQTEWKKTGSPLLRKEPDTVKKQQASCLWTSHVLFTLQGTVLFLYLWNSLTLNIGNRVTSPGHAAMPGRTWNCGTWPLIVPNNQSYPVSIHQFFRHIRHPSLTSETCRKEDK